MCIPEHAQFKICITEYSKYRVIVQEENMVDTLRMWRVGHTYTKVIPRSWSGCSKARPEHFQSYVIKEQ